MREETRQRFEREVRRQRLVRVLLIAGGAAVVLAVVVAMTLLQRPGPANDPVIAEAEVTGRVEKWQNAPRRTGLPYLIMLDVRLEDGRVVQAASSAHSSAKVGDTVRLLSRRHQSGRVDHIWP